MKMSTRAEEVIARLKAQGLTLATAESCTGGLIGAHIQMGIGDGVIPAILDRSVIDKANRKIINL